MKNAFSRISAFLKTKKLVSIMMVLVVVGVVVILSNVFGELTPLKSIDIFSENADFSKKEAGSWKITKSARWSAKGIAEITFDIDTIRKTKSRYTDVIFVLDISGSMEGNRISKVKQDTVELINSLLEDEGNHAAVISFDTTSTIHSGLTNNKSELISKINSLSVTGNTNYYQALVNVDSVLKTYTKEEDREMVVLFLTDGFPNEDTPNEVGYFNYLKSAYPYATFNAIQYEMGSSILEPIKKISDYQYVASMSNLNNVLFDVAIPAYNYEELTISDFIDTRYFYVDKETDVKAESGDIVFDKENQKVVWKLNGLKSGRSSKLTIKARLKTELFGKGGIYPTNNHEEVVSLLNGINENVTSNDTPILADNYKVKYEANAPESCTLEGIVPDERNHSVYDTVEISSNQLKCEGYQFKGWKVATKEIERVSDEYFIMPEENVVIRGNWSRLSLQKSMEGTIKESLTLYKQVELDSTTSGKYAMKYTGDTSTFTGDQEVYYYYGSASGNNVLFANYCWKIIRTTDTGGVKLLYNGVPDASGACNKTGDNSALTKEQMGTSSENVAFNSNYTSPADVGYMYNTRYTYNPKSFSTSSQAIINTGTMSNSETYNYYYSDTYTYASSRYTMDTPEQYTWTDDYESLVGKYTCRSTSTSGYCSSLYYVIKAESGRMYFITLSNGKDLAASSTVMFSNEVTLNEDGTYTLTNPVQVNRLDWNTNYGTYKNYYTCGSNEVTCNASTMKKVTSTNSTAYSYSALSNNYKYGNNFTWDGTNYTLTDTVDSLGIPSGINTHHYTCWNTSGVCNKLNYIYYVNGSTPCYIILSDGKSVEDALNEMFYNDNVNTNNSTIKTAIDYWYSNNMTEFTPYLEDTVWCNDRSMSNQSSNGWNPNGGSTSTYLYFGNRTDLTCKNKNDRFTVDEANGNGALTYPVGMIDVTETSLAYVSGKSPNGSGSSYWGLSPYIFYDYLARGYDVISNGIWGDSDVYYTDGVRPAVSLREGIEYSSGDGSSDKPFVVAAEAVGYKISIQEGSNAMSSINLAGERRTIKLSSTLENYGVSSFKMNGTLIKGSTFVMPAEDVLITDVVLVEQTIIESEHNPYSNSLNEEKEKTFEGVTSLTVELDYQTESTSYDYIYLYDSTGKQYGKYGGSTRKTETITIPGNYIKILFHTNYSGNNYYGYKATITPVYD